MTYGPGQGRQHPHRRGRVTVRLLAVAAGLALAPVAAWGAVPGAPDVDNGQELGLVGTSTNYTIESFDGPGETATFQIVAPPTHGTLEGPGPVACDNGRCRTSVTYTPSGTTDDAFAYTATDQHGHESDVATVNIDVIDPDAPRAFPDSEDVVKDVTTSIELYAYDPTGADLTFSISTGPARGTLGTIGGASCDARGCTARVEYTPPPGYVGADSFQYQASNGSKTSDAATFGIQVIAPPSVRPGAPRIGSTSAGKRGGPRTGVARWTAPASTGGAPITAYVVTATKYQGRKVLRTKSATVSASRRSYDMVVGAGKWRFRVAAVNRVGRGGFSALSNLVKAK
jgi:hypothetical protein